MTSVENRASAPLPAARNWLQRIYSAFGRAHARRVALRELHALDNRLLQDIGLRRDQVGETVNAMFRTNPVAESAQSSREVEVRAIAAAGVESDRQYPSAA